ncbi:MAG TPA: hypothetical protein EYN66_06285 [Myxococcales bacterium]|nr:hypothetical protein [Myxococcales bacterium]
MIRVTNRTRDIVTLPAPYQGILMAYRSEVLDTTEAEFVAAIGGLDTAGGVFTIEAVAASVAATVAVDRTITDADLIYAIPNADPIYYAITTNIQVFANSSFGALTVNMTNPDGSDLPEGVIYTIKDVGGDASTHNITVSTPYTVIGGSGDDYIIDTDYASVGFYRSGSSFVPLPGVSSGGGASTLGGLTNVPAGADTLGMGDEQEVLYWDGADWTVGPLDKRNRITEVDYEEPMPGSPASGPFLHASPDQLSTGYEVYVLTTGVNQGAVTVNLPTIASVTALTGDARSARIYIKATANAASYSITVEPHTSDSGATIDGAASKVLGTGWQSITLVAEASSWFIL